MQLKSYPLRRRKPPEPAPRSLPIMAALRFELAWHNQKTSKESFHAARP